MKSVIIAFSNPLLTNWITTVLSRNGYTVEFSCKTAGDVIRVSDFCTSPVVIAGFQFTDMTVEDLMTVIDGRLAIVTIVLPHQRGLVGRSDMVVLPYPISAEELIQTLELVEKTAAQIAVSPSTRSVCKIASTERSAEEKLLILKAKENLMEQFQMTESQAHRFLQKTSMDRGLKLVDAARMVIDNSLTV
jgi:response regulator NasT